jgi:RHS repeat-associated protein
MYWRVPAGHSRDFAPAVFLRSPWLRLVAVVAFLAGPAIVGVSLEVVVFGPQTYVRGTDQPVTITKTFRVDSITSPFRLRVTNHGVTSAAISINGREVFGPEDFIGQEKDGTLLERPVALSAGDNTIAVELRSKPGTSLSVQIFADLAPTVRALEPARLTVAASGGLGSLTVSVQNPDPLQDTHIALNSGDPTIAAVAAEVVLLAGTTTGLIMVTGENAGGPVPITASLNGTSATSEVTVLARPAPPTLAVPLVDGMTIVGGVGVADALVNVQVNGGAGGAGSVGADGHFAVPVAPLIAGQVVRATQTISGLTSLLSAPVIVQARPPAPTVNTPLIAGGTQVAGTSASSALIDVFVNGAHLATGLAGVDGTFTIAVPVLVAGQQVTATQTVVGVTSIPSAAVTVVAAPAPPSITSPLIAGATSVTGSGSPGATVEAFVEGGSVGAAIANGSGTWTLALGSPLVVGQHVKARQTVGGIPSAFSADVIVVARPPAPVINTPLVDGSTSVGGTGVAGASVTVFINAGAAGSTAVGGDGTWTLTLNDPLVVGQIVTATETVGGIESNPSPPTTVVARPPAPMVNGPLVAGATSVTGAGVGGATVALFVGNGAAGSGTVNSAGVWTVLLATSLVVGEQVTANQTVAGVTSGLSPPVTVVARPPAPTISGPLVAGAMTVSGTGIAGASLEVFANGASLGTTAVGGGGTWSLPLVTALIAGQVITAQQTVGGVPSALSTPVTVQASLTAIVITPAPAAMVTKGQSLQFSARGTFSDGSTQDPLEGVTWISDNVTVASIAAPGLATGAGAGIANIRATVGAVSSSLTALTVKPLPPTITEPLVAGAMTVSGTGVEPGATVQVFVNGLPRGPTAVAGGAGQWTVSGFVPALIAADSVTARQTANGVQSDLSSPIIVGVGAPTLLSVNPASAVQGQQNLNVVISGQFTHFVQGTTTASFGAGVSVATLTVNSSTNATAVLNIDAAAAAGARSVTVTTGAEVVLLVNAFTVSASPVVCTPPPSGMIGWWPGDGNANDILGGHGGTPQGGATFVSGAVGQAFSFDGAAALINIPAFPDLDIHNAVTIDAWVKPTKFGNLVPGTCSPYAAGCGVIAGRPFGYQLTILPDGRLRLGFPRAPGGPVEAILDSIGFVPTDTFTFVAATYDSSTGVAAIYINNVLDSTTVTSGPIYSPSKSFQIGGFSDASLPVGYGAFTGIIDEVELYARALSSTEVQAIFTAGAAGKCKNSGTPGCVAPPSGLVGWWRAEGSGADQIGGHDGTMNGGVAFAPGEVGEAFILSGTNGYVEVPGSSALDMPGPFTIELWVRLNSLANQQYLVIKDSETNEGKFHNYELLVLGDTPIFPFIAPAHTIGFAIGDGTALYQLFSHTTLSVGVWYHIAAVYDGNNQIIYVNGQPDASQAIGARTLFTTPTKPMRLGIVREGGVFSYPLDGLMDEVSLFNRALSASEVHAIDAAATFGKCIVPTGPPVLSSVSPGTGTQGQQNLNVSISGQFTHFIQGVSQVTFSGAGIAANGVTVTSATSLTANISIALTASLGPRTVIVTTGAEVASLANGFTVSGGPPVITQVNPNTGQQGQQNLTVNITGAFSSFVQGITQLNFGAGITVTTVSVNDSTHLTAQVTLAADAPVGPHDVTATTGSEQAILAGGFIVTQCASEPTNWMQLTQTGTLPSPRLQHTTVYDQSSNRLIAFGGYLCLSGVNCPVVNNEVWLLLNADGSAGVSSWLQLNPSGASPSARRGHSAAYDSASNRMIVFAGNAETAFVNDVWVLVNANGLGGSPFWQQLSPSGAPPAPRRFSQALYDRATNRLVVFGGEVSVSSRVNDVWVLTNANGLSGTPAWIQLSPGGVVPSPRAFHYANLDSTANRLMVFGGGDVVNGVGDPVSLYRNDMWILTNANGLGGAPTWIQLLDQGAAGSPSPRLIADGTSGSVYLANSNRFAIFGGTTGACSGSIAICSSTSVSNEVWVLSNANGIGGNPSWTRLALSGGPQRTLGDVVYDESADRVINYGGGLESLAAGRPNSADTWALTNISGASCGTSPPAILSITPSVGRQGQTSLPVTIAGQFTHWAQGTTTASFGPGITVVSLIVNSATSLSATLSIDPAAAVGARTVTVTTGAEVVSLVNAFTVNASSGNAPPQARDDSYAVTGRETAITLRSGFQARILYKGAPFAKIPGLAADPRGQLFVADYDLALSQIFTLPLFSRLPSILHSGLPFSNPSRMLVGDGRPSVGRDLIASDHNSIETESCCDGTVFRVNPNTGAISVLARGAGGFRTGGDPFGIALGPGNAFGTDLFVMDFQGASPDPPVLYRVNASGTTSLVVSSPSKWTTTQTPMYLAFADGNGFGNDLFVGDPAFQGGTPTLWRVTADGTLSVFRQGESIGAPSVLRFAPGGAFGTSLYFIDLSYPGVALKRLLADGTVELFATNIPHDSSIISPSDFVFAPDGHALYIAGQGTILEIVPEGTQSSLDVPAPGVLSNDDDPNGDRLTSILVGGPTHGTVSLLDDGSFSYVPDVAFSGIDTFTYKASDGSLQSNVATVTITVVAPAATNQPPYVSAGAAQAITLPASATLNGAASDDGLPSSGTLSSQWSKLSGPGDATFSDANALATAAAFNVPGIYVLRLTASDGELSSTDDVTVIVGGAALQSVSPNAGQQGQQNLSVTVAGQGTHFLEGTSQVSFGSGITVTSVTVSNPTSLVAHVSIALGASPIQRTVTVTTGTEIASLVNGFAVTTVPLVLSIAPNTGVQGQLSLGVTITGQSTHFTNSSAIDLGAGLGVTNVSAVDATHLSGQLSIAANATVGARTLSVTSGGEVVTLSSAFVVSAGTAEIVSVISDEAKQGETVVATITGRFTNWVNGQTKVSLGQGISVGGAPPGAFGPVLVTSPTTAAAEIRVNPEANWHNVQPSGQMPSFLFEHSTAYDPISDQLIIYGGDTGGNALDTLYRVSHASGSGPANWTQISAAGTSPGGRAAQTTIYDSLNDRMIIFGGAAGAYDPIFNDVYVLANAAERSGQATWLRLTPSDPKPLPRIWHNAVYDATNNRMIIFGGRRASAEYFNDIWVLTNANGLGGASQWIQLSPAGTGPGPRYYVSSAYDEGSNRLMIWTYSQVDPSQSDVWILSNANGLGGSPAWTQYPIAALVGNSRMLGYEKSSNTGVAVLGCQTLTAALLDANASAGTPEPQILGPLGIQPPVRCDYSGSDYDPVTDQLFLVGGGLFINGFIPPTANDVWVLRPAIGAATVGARTVRVQTGSEKVSKASVFRVAPASSSPALMLWRALGYRGQRVTIEVRSTNADFVTGSTSANFGQGISVGGGPEGGVGPLFVLSSNRAFAELTISSTATLGLRDVTISINGTDFQLSGYFDVLSQGGGGLIPPVLGPIKGTPGQQVNVQVTDANGRFQQGVTRVYFGQGITVNSVTVQTTTSLVANLSIAPDAEIGTRDVAIVYVNGLISPFPFDQSFVILGGFAVLPSTSQPALTSVFPAAGYIGDQVAVTINGQGTHFAQGVTQLDFGPGVAVNSVTVTSPTTLAVQLVISPVAELGTRTVTASTGTEVVSLPGAFAVMNVVSLPTLTTVVPAAAPPGASLAVVVSASNTHFVQGATFASFGPDIVVDSVSVSTPTSLTANITVGGTAAIGVRSVTVATGSEVASLASGFAVSATAPAITQISPTSGRQGQAGPVAIVGVNTHFVQGTTQVDFGTGVTVNSVTAACSTCLEASVSITEGASIGPRSVTVTTGAEIVSLANGFTVQPGTPILTSLSRASGHQGETFPVTITGKFTHFTQGTTQVDLGAGIVVSAVTVTSPTTLSGQVAIDATAALSSRTLTVTTGSEVVFVNNVFAVIAAAALTHIDITPSGTVTLTKGQTVQFSARGTFSDNTVQDPLAGVTWNSDVTSVASITSSGLATGVAAGISQVSATKSGIQSATTGFVVKPPPVGIFGPIGAGSTVVDGAAAEPGASVQVFVNGLPRGPTTIANGGGLWTVAGLAPALVVGDSITAVQTVNGVTSDSSGVIIVTAGTPTLLSVNPATGTQGQQNLNVAITGQFTHFTQGVSTVFFASNTITLNSVTVSSPTSLTANISIALNASLVPRTVTVTTGAEVVALANAFTVQPATNQAPTIAIAPIWTVTLPNRLTLTYTVTDDGLPLGGALTVSWEPISGPGNVGFQSQTPTSISVGFDLAGTYVLRITATDTQLTTTKDVTVTVSGTVGQGPTVSIASPTEGTEVTGPISVIGSVASPALASWTLEFRMQAESTFRPLATGTTAVTNGVLGTLDPTLLLNGIGLIQVRATDIGGQTSIAGPVSVVVTQNQKVGNFTVSFNDLTVPVAGLPIQVVRTYDSRNKAAGDFGVGWKLDIGSVSVATNGALGDNWTGTVSGGFFPNYCIQAAKPHVVTVTFSDGTVFQFQPALNPACQQLVPLSQTTVGFVPISTTPPNVSLVAVGNNQPFVGGEFPGPIELLDLDEATTFDPDLYRLTMPDGRVLVISKQHGLQSMADANGNTLAITPAGITHSSGKSVTFQRDGSNRITQITDPAGSTIEYAHNASGDLVSVTDRSNNTTTFTYNASHGLLTIVDPRGVQPIKNVYDDSGRLIQHIDAFGKTINYTHNLNARQEVVTDRLGNPTVNEYDTNGNVVQVTDAMGGVTSRTYDGRNNLLTETSPLGKTRTFTYDANNNRLSETDALNQTTQYTYNSGNQVLTITDALDRVTTNTYDAHENLTSTIDAMGKTTTYTYNARGLRTAMTDPLGNVTAYEYDASGNLTTQTDVLGHVTTSTYDPNGNRLTESKTQTTAGGPQTVLTQYQYDAQNRLTQTTFADGGTTRTVYNGIGKPETMIDPLGRQTTYEYDLMGRLTKTTFPDTTTESATYDAEGDRITSVDRASRTTSYAYDALKRLFQTTFADDATTGTTYDAGGEVTAVTDGRGNVTHYAYDEAGRRASVTDALTHVTTFVYDAVGNQSSMKDANGNVTQYQYDNANRRLKTIYPDTTNDSVVYDAMGRTVSKTDQAGKTTQFQYDKLGRLTAVIDALSQTTSYTYDELGNRTSQTDANGHVTQFTYDALGRRVGRMLPLGMSETSTYNAAGKLAAKTDFNGKTTTYAYDLLNRLTSKTPDPTLAQPTVQFSYNATGQRAQMIDSSGTTTYVYDLRDRLATKATPQGTLTYTYDQTGDLASIRSSNTGGTSVNYTHNALNRLATVTDNRLANGVTTYAYDSVGNLGNFAYPNGVKHAYTYNTLNRLTNLAVADQTSSTLASYGYTLGPTGNRTAVAEFGGRHVDYTYDSLYRLTVETITGGIGGTTTYAYDPVGNRLSQSSPSVGIVMRSYDANDRLTTDTYDNDGNTIASGVNQFTYDFENHLDGENGGVLSIVYDGDGNRVAKTVAGVTTRYLVDGRNLTGYAQVLEELSGGAVQRVYTYGLNRISQSQAGEDSFYGYDGHGNVRFLTEATGTITDSYDYDAFGNVLSHAGTTPNVYLYSGEQNDPTLGLYYLRARYLSQSTGRFWTMDNVEGNRQSPLSLHKYAYAGNEPVLRVDPSGNQFDVASIGLEIASFEVLSSVTTVHSGGLFTKIKPNSDITVHIWSYRGSNAAWGHASMTLNTKHVHISWWPQGEHYDSIPFVSDVYTADANDPQTYELDIVGENGQLPDQEIHIPCLDENKISAWWYGFKGTHQWRTLTQNCSTTVADGLKAGGAAVGPWASYNAVWTPAAVAEFATQIRGSQCGLR